MFSLISHPDFLLSCSSYPSTTAQPNSEVAYKIYDFLLTWILKKYILRGVSITALLCKEQRSFLGIWPKVEGGGDRDKVLVSRWG